VDIALLEKFVDSAREAKALVVLVDMGSMAELAAALDGDMERGDAVCRGDTVKDENENARDMESEIEGEVDKEGEKEGGGGCPNDDPAYFSAVALVAAVYSEVGASALTLSLSPPQQKQSGRCPPLPVRVLFLSANLGAPLRATVDSAVAQLRSAGSIGAAGEAAAAGDATAALHYSGTVLHAWLFRRLGCRPLAPGDVSSNPSGSSGDGGDGGGSICLGTAQERMASVVWVHHGGAGSTACAARWGVPQVAVPLAMDQGLWAARVVSLGLGAVVDLADLTDDGNSNGLGRVGRDRVGGGKAAEAERCGATVRQALQRSLSLACASPCRVAAQALALKIESTEPGRENYDNQIHSPGSSAGAKTAAEAALGVANTGQIGSKHKVR
jgi:hypothetical protein